MSDLLKRLSGKILTIDLSHLPEEEKKQIKKSIESLPTVEEYINSEDGKKFLDEVVEDAINNYYKN